MATSTLASVPQSIHWLSSLPSWSIKCFIDYDDHESLSCSLQKRWKKRASSPLKDHTEYYLWGTYEYPRLSFYPHECSNSKLKDLPPGIGRLDSMHTAGKSPPFTFSSGHILRCLLSSVCLTGNKGLNAHTDLVVLQVLGPLLLWRM